MFQIGFLIAHIFIGVFLEWSFVLKFVRVFLRKLRSPLHPLQAVWIALPLPSGYPVTVLGRWGHMVFCGTVMVTCCVVLWWGAVVVMGSVVVLSCVDPCLRALLSCIFAMMLNILFNFIHRAECRWYWTVPRPVLLTGAKKSHLGYLISFELLYGLSEYRCH